MMDQNNNHTINTLNGSMDDLSLRQKQLPFRQQAVKPLLKYSSSEPGPIYLYQNPDVTPGAMSPNNNAAGTTAAVSSAPNSPSKVLPSRNKTSISSAMINNQASKHFSTSHINYVPSRDPYARPLSAKDLMTLGIERTKSLNHIMNNTLAGSLTSNMHATSMNNSTVFKPSKPQVEVQQQKYASEVVTVSTNQTASKNTQSQPAPPPTTTASTRVVSIQPTQSSVVTQTAKEKFEASLSKPPSGLERGTRPPSALRRPLSSTVRNPNYTPSKPYSEISGKEEEEFKMVSDTKPKLETKPKKLHEDSLNNKITKAISNLSAKTSRSKHMVTQLSSSNESLSDASTRPQSRQVRTRDPSPAQSDSNGAKNTTESNSRTSQGSAGSCQSAGSEKRSTETATVYYLKSSKPEVKIAEPRPACEGRDSKSATEMSPSRPVSGKSTVSVRTKSKTVSSSSNASGSTAASPDEDDIEEDDDGESLDEREPGDGEAYDDFDEEEDDGIDALEDDELEGGDDDEDSISSSSASRAHSARARSASLGRTRLDPNQPIRMKSARRRTHSSYYDHNTQPALIKSLFQHVPPYLNFITQDEKMETLPWEYRRLLKWRMCSITPNIVKHVIARSGFRPTKKHYDWLGCWGRHMKAQGFKSIREYQKLNHFPGSFQIGRKDRLWRNLSKLQVSFGKKEFSFFPTTYVLPYDMKGLKRAWEDGGSKAKWIIKPPASARGIGIKVINKWNQIPKKRPVIVQKYLGRPLLINESKFDCRIYVYVTSYDPLRIYIYEDGLVRFCSTKYSHSMKHINDKYMHLTNYSIQKKANEYESNADDNICQGHKWSLKALWGYLLKRGVNTNEIWKNIKDLIVKTIISAESSINSFIKSNVKNRYSVHELFGFDILLDETYKPWVLEVNISPSLHSNSQLDINIKGGMIKDLHNLAGFRIPDKNDVVANPSTENYRITAPHNRYCADKRVQPQTLSSDEKAKHSYYSQRYQDESVMSSIIDILTPDDIRILIESIDEDSRKGGFQRVFPTPSTHKYLRYFENQRYYNLFLDQWCQKFNRIEAKGIALIEAGCRSKIHLQNPTSDPRHQWCPPSARMSISASSLSLRSTRLPPLASVGDYGTTRSAGIFPTHKKQRLPVTSSSASKANKKRSSKPPPAI